MAAKNAGPGNKNRATAASADDDSADIERLIDGNGNDDSPGNGQADRAGPANGGAVDGDDDESGSGGSSRKGSGSGSGSGAASGGGSRNRSGGGTASNRGSGDSRHARGTGSERTSTDKDAGKVGDSVPGQRLKPPPKSTKSDAADLPSNNKEIIADLFQFVFWGVAQATGLPEWELPEDDSAVIGENGDKWLKSLGPKRAKNVMATLNKMGPSVAFFGSIGMALVPRVRLTINSAKNGALRPTQERKPAAGNPVVPAPASSPPDVGGPNLTSPAGLREVPFSSKDFSEVTQGHVSEGIGGSID